MTMAPPPASGDAPSRLWSTLKAVFRARLTTGVITILPIVITVWVVRVIFMWMRDASLWVVEWYLFSRWGLPVLESWGVHPDHLTKIGLEALPTHMRWGIYIFSVLLTILVLYVVGMFAANLIGRRVIHWLEQLLNRLPLVKTVYRSLKQILTALSGAQQQNFQRVALVPFPNPLTRSVGFVTGMHRDAITGEDLCSIFIATTPNPTSGFVLLVKRSDLIEMDWSIEEAVRMVMSGGILVPSAVSVVAPPGVPPLPSSRVSDPRPAGRQSP